MAEHNRGYRTADLITLAGPDQALVVTVCHYPPGASKWNPVEQLAQAAADVLGRAHGIAAAVGLDQFQQVADQRRVVFLSGGRPPPGRRIRALGRSARSSANSSRPRR